MKRLLDNLITVVTLAAGTLQFQFGGTGSAMTQSYWTHSVVAVQHQIREKNGWMPKQARLVGMSVH